MTCWLDPLLPLILCWSWLSNIKVAYNKCCQQELNHWSQGSKSHKCSTLYARLIFIFLRATICNKSSTTKQNWEIDLILSSRNSETITCSFFKFPGQTIWTAPCLLARLIYIRMKVREGSTCEPRAAPLREARSPPFSAFTCAAVSTFSHVKGRHPLYLRRGPITERCT